MRKNLEEAANIFSTMAAPVEGTETTSSFVITNDESSPSPCSWVRACGEKGGGVEARGGKAAG